MAPTQLPAPAGGTFMLLRPVNGATCPQCNEHVPGVWAYVKADAPATYRPVACTTCAGTSKED